jgi:hypothetical protein
MINLFNYLLVLNIFLGGFVLFTSPFEFYIGYVFMTCFLTIYVIRYPNVAINKYFLNMLVILAICSLINVYMENDTIFLMLKQLLGILITGSAYYLLIKANKYDIIKVFTIYLHLALIVAAIGIFQEISFLIGFELGYDYSYMIPKWAFSPTDWGVLRLNAVFMEPSHYAISMAPAVFVSLANILGKRAIRLNKPSSILIIISALLTFSVVAYIIALISMMIIGFKTRRIKSLSLTFSIMAITFYAAYNYVPEIKLRVDDTLGVTRGAIEGTEANLSTFALASNTYVAYKSFMGNPLLGNGLGSHPMSYDKFILDIPGDTYKEGLLWLNREDAGSLFLRIASETGLIGILVVFYFIIKFYLVNRHDKSTEIMSNAVLILFLASLFRMGHYFYNGLFFFIWLYYFAYKKHHVLVSQGKA